MKISDINQDLDTFVQKILSGDIQVGVVVRQTELCEILEISKTPLRELLVLLRELELIEVKPRAGFKVLYPDIEFMRENMQLRVILENHAIGAFNEIVTDEWIEVQIREHEKALRDLENAGELQALNESIFELDRNFHRVIVAALENSAVSKAHEYTQIKLQIARQVHLRTPPRKTNMVAMQDHLTILAALKTHNLDDIRAALEVHFTQSARNTLVGY